MANSCEAARPAPLRCPTLPEVQAAAMALLPKGRAWQSNEGGPVSPIDRGFNASAFSSNAFSTRQRIASELWQFWTAIAAVFVFANQRLCDLRLEFWCATHKETDDLWMAEYGLPDACDPFPDLCTKVAAIGGTRCEYYAFIAGRAGWSISCRDYFVTCGVRPGCAKVGPGRKPGGRGAAQLAIVVDLKNSTAYTGTFHAKPKAGRMKAGRRLACGPDLSPLECLLGRVVHAEIQIVYEAIE